MEEGLSAGWAVAWVVYSVMTAILTVAAVKALHRGRWWLFVISLFLLALYWLSQVGILIDNCGAGGDCDPYKGIHGWSPDKAMWWATVPPAVSTIGTAIIVRLRRPG